jgi:hypothetical protein
VDKNRIDVFLDLIDLIEEYFYLLDNKEMDQTTLGQYIAINNILEKFYLYAIKFDLENEEYDKKYQEWLKRAQ